MSGLREDFETAIAQVEGTEDKQDLKTSDEGAADKGGLDNGAPEAGRETKTTEKEADPVREKAPGAPSQEADSGSAGGASDTGAESGDGGEGKTGPEEKVKAPVGWTPKAREHWEKLPADVQAQVTKRETEIARALEDGKEYRKSGERYGQVVDKYQSVFAAEGVQDPVAGFEYLLQTMSLLRMGSQQQKAEKLAGFVKSYGVDLQSLDAALASQISGKPGGAPKDDLDARLEARLAPVNQLIEEIHTARTASEQFQENTRKTNIQTFADDPANEFYGDVYMDMADILDLSAKRNEKLTLKDAYDRACRFNPDVSSVLTERANRQAILDQEGKIRDKENAASSINGLQGDPARKGSGEVSLRGELAQAWDNSRRA